MARGNGAAAAAEAIAAEATAAGAAAAAAAAHSTRERGGLEEHQWKEKSFYLLGGLQQEWSASSDRVVLCSRLSLSLARRAPYASLCLSGDTMRVGVASIRTVGDRGGRRARPSGCTCEHACRAHTCT